jgi:hypothetical protein
MDHVGGESSSAAHLETTSQNVTFIDNAEGEIIMAGSSVSAVAKIDGTDDLQLGAFLSRPTQIATFTWNMSTPLGTLGVIAPWFLFLNNANIRKKIDNYAFIRGKMHVKVMVNGTPFQAGLVRVCYTPLLGFTGPKIRDPPSGSEEPTLVPLSQQPGFYITPAANAGGQMELPFFYNKNWLELTNAGIVTGFGTLNFEVYAPLIVAVSGGTTAVTVQVFAWMTEVELMCSTSALALQGDEYDEPQGVVSKPASAVASIASMLTTIPYIGPFARATAIGATAVGNIAKIFGYTNVPVIADVHGMMPMNAPMLASSNIGTAVQKFSLDPKQELSIDPTLHGLKAQDELSLPYIKSKESFLGATSWNTATAVDTLLWVNRVTPSLFQQVAVNNTASVTVGTRVYHTPLSYVGQMFYNWRGSLVFRIKVVATKFHKGRLKISYDPVGNIATTNPDVNSVYTKIVDIGEEDDIEIEVPYHQAYPWLNVDKTLTTNWSASGALTRRDLLDNGLLTIRVLTTLTAPTTGSIRILVFTKGGDDFEFANPDDHIGGETTNEVPSFFALQGEELTSITPTRHVLGTKAAPHSERYAQNYGEQINSLRCLLHRYHTLDTVPIPNFTNEVRAVFKRVYRILPYTPGYNGAGPTTSLANRIVAASGTAPFAFNTMPHVSYVANMFVGCRGGMNYVVTPQTDLYGKVTDARVARITTPASTDDTLGTVSSQFWPASTYSSQLRFGGRGQYLADGLAGMAITHTDTNGSISFQLPDLKYSNFTLVAPASIPSGNSADGTDRQGAMLQLTLSKATGSEANRYITVQTQVAAAPDFTCLFWLCCPTLDYATVVPTPA